MFSTWCLGDFWGRGNEVRSEAKKGIPVHSNFVDNNKTVFTNVVKAWSCYKKYNLLRMICNQHSWIRNNWLIEKYVYSINYRNVQRMMMLERLSRWWKWGLLEIEKRHICHVYTFSLVNKPRNNFGLDAGPKGWNLLVTWKRFIFPTCPDVSSLK